MHHLYHNINLNIQIADKISFTVCNRLKIDKSIKNLSATATLTLPREFRNAMDGYGQSVNIGQKSILDYISRGDAIKIAFGYDDHLETEFEGYITSVSADFPLLLECEDEMFQLKKSPRIDAYISSGQIKDILAAAIPSKYKIELNESYEVGSWMIENATPYEVLKELSEKTGLQFHFEDNTTLKAGLPVDLELTEPKRFNFNENVRAGSSLVYRAREDRKLEVTVNSKQADGSENSHTAGEPGGDTKTINFPRLSKAECKKWAEKELEMNVYDGFEGSFDSWCLPRTKPGDAAELVRPFYEDRHQDGTYLIEAVSILIDANNGIKRTNQISHKL